MDGAGRTARVAVPPQPGDVWRLNLYSLSRRAAPRARLVAAARPGQLPSRRALRPRALRRRRAAIRVRARRARPTRSRRGRRDPRPTVAGGGAAAVAVPSRTPPSRRPRSRRSRGALAASCAAAISTPPCATRARSTPPRSPCSPAAGSTTTSSFRSRSAPPSRSRRKRSPVAATAPPRWRLLRENHERYVKTSIATRLQKNLHLLELEGKPAPALDREPHFGPTVPSLAALGAAHQPARLFFWAHCAATARRWRRRSHGSPTSSARAGSGDRADAAVRRLRREEVAPGVERATSTRCGGALRRASATAVPWRPQFARGPAPRQS